jgi:hypothetical protein
MPGLKFAELSKDPKALEAMLKFTKKDMSSEQVLFLIDKGNNEAIYKKFISAKSQTQVNLNGELQKGLDALANAKPFSKYKDMGTLLQKARDFVRDAFDRDVMNRFEKSEDYKAYYNAKFPEIPKTKALVPQLIKDMADGTAFYNSAIATVKSKGKPANPIEVNRMFDSARMRHDKVHNVFTERAQKDKTFIRDNYKDLFTKKDAFSKLWGEYRKLLGK